MELPVYSKKLSFTAPVRGRNVTTLAISAEYVFIQAWVTPFVTRQHDVTLHTLVGVVRARYMPHDTLVSQYLVGINQRTIGGIRGTHHSAHPLYSYTNRATFGCFCAHNLHFYSVNIQPNCGGYLNTPWLDVSIAGQCAIGRYEAPVRLDVSIAGQCAIGSYEAPERLDVSRPQSSRTIHGSMSLHLALVYELVLLTLS